MCSEVSVVTYWSNCLKIQLITGLRLEVLIIFFRSHVWVGGVMLYSGAYILKIMHWIEELKDGG